MPKKKPQIREVTISIRDDETLEQYMEKARDAFYLEEKLKSMMSGPQIPFEQVLRDLNIISDKQLERYQTKKRPRVVAQSKRKKK